MTATNIQPAAEICSASHDDAQFGERAIKPLCDISGFDYGTPLYAGAAPAAVAPQDVVAWMHPETLNVISAAHKHDMSTEYGAETRRKAESYSVALVRAGEPAAAAPALEAPAAPQQGFQPGKPGADVEVAWLLVRSLEGDGEGATDEADTVVLALRGDDGQWFVAGDWRANSTRDSVFEDGGWVVGWMPYEVPAARLAAAPQAPAAPVVDTSDPVLGEWPRVSGVGRDAESPRTLLLYLQAEASDDELRAIHDALLDGGALATHALSELMHIGYRVDGGKLVPPEKLSDRASEFFGVTAVAAKATAAHSDDLAVDRFAAEMKFKLAAARAKGRGGWETCPPDVLSRMLREHADKGDPRDVANFCMFLWCLGHPIGAAPAAPAVDASDTALLDAMERERIAVIPEFEGPWDAQIFGEDEAALACGSGATPREAITEALASLDARKAHDAAQAKEGGAA